MKIVYDSEYNANVHQETERVLLWVREAVRLNPSLPMEEILDAASEWNKEQVYTLAARGAKVADPAVSPVEAVEVAPPVVEPVEAETAVEAVVEAPEEVVEAVEPVVESETVVEDITAPEIEEVATIEEAVEAVEDAIAEDAEAEPVEAVLPAITAEQNDTDTISLEDLMAGNVEEPAATEFSFSESNYEAYNGDTVEKVTAAAEAVKATVVEEEPVLPKTSINDAVDFSSRKRKRGNLAGAALVDNGGDTPSEDGGERRVAVRRGAVSGFGGDDKQSRIQENIGIIFRDPDAINGL